MDILLGQNPGQSGSGILGFVPIILIGLVFYLLILRPQTKQRKQHENVLATLKTVMYPFLPFSSSKLHTLLGFKDSIQENGWIINPPPSGTELPIPEPLFDKLDETILEV